MKRKLIFFAAFLLASCATVQTRVPEPNTALLEQEQDEQSAAAFKKYKKQYQRLDRLARQILTANADLCSKTWLDPQIVTHRLKSYPKPLRDSAGAHLAAAEKPSVFFAAPQGALTGPRLGDIVIGGDGKPRSLRSEAVQSGLENRQIRIRRGDEELLLSRAADPACDYALHLKFSGAINAYATGRSIIVTTAMMDFAKDDDELALILGHELAHNTMKHVRKSIQNMILSGFAKRTTRPFESEADYVGLYYMARAGFEIDGAENIWRRIGQINPKSIVHATTHPVTPARFLAIRAAIDEINEKRAAGEPLLPNPRD